MHIWTLDKWRKFYDLSDPKHRSGMRLRFDRNVGPEVKRACKEFAAWLRKQYFFPIRVPVYIKFGEKIRANDGEMASATCLIPESKQMEPYIRIATGDYYTLELKASPFIFFVFAQKKTIKMKNQNFSGEIL